MQTRRCVWPSIRLLLMRSLDTLHIWQQRHHSRYDLLHLNDRLLKDIGINRADAEREAHKPFWQP